MKIPIALQLYSVRVDAEKDLFSVLEKVAKMGYEGVEFAGYYGHDPKEIKKVLDANGLIAEGTHTGYEALNDENFNATVDLHLALGAKFCIIPWIPEDMRNTPEACKATGDKMAVLCAKLNEYGLRTGFHAHDGDMKPLAGGKCAWDLISEFTPKEFILQYDTANGVSGGADAVQPILNNPGRNASLHLKEWAGQHGAAPIGEGDIPWQRVFEAAENGGGVEWYVVEHEAESEVPPIVSVEQCLVNLRKMGK